MKTLALAAGCLLATAATAASAQYYSYDRPYPNARGADPGECWNPHAGHFERVRPGEVQDDLDFSRCRSYGARYYEPAPPSREACWNPRAGHFEAVRPGERQDDLDFSRCRFVPEGDYYRWR